MTTVLGFKRVFVLQVFKLKTTHICLFKPYFQTIFSVIFHIREKEGGRERVCVLLGELTEILVSVINLCLC